MRLVNIILVIAESIAITAAKDAPVAVKDGQPIFRRGLSSRATQQHAYGFTPKPGFMLHRRDEACGYGATACGTQYCCSFSGQCCDDGSGCCDILGDCCLGSCCDPGFSCDPDPDHPDQPCSCYGSGCDANPDESYGADSSGSIEPFPSASLTLPSAFPSSSGLGFGSGGGGGGSGGDFSGSPRSGGPAATTVVLPGVAHRLGSQRVDWVGVLGIVLAAGVGIVAVVL